MRNPALRCFRTCLLYLKPGSRDLAAWAGLACSHRRVRRWKSSSSSIQPWLQQSIVQISRRSSNPRASSQLQAHLLNSPRAISRKSTRGQISSQNPASRASRRDARNIKFLALHGGGTLPFLAGGLDIAAPTRGGGPMMKALLAATLCARCRSRSQHH